MRSPCAPSTSQRCLSSGLIARPRAAPKAGLRDHHHRRRAIVGAAAASASADENKTTSTTSSPSSSPSRSSSSWTATDGERSEDFLQALGTRQQYNINVDHGECCS